MYMNSVINLCQIQNPDPSQVHKLLHEIRLRILIVYQIYAQLFWASPDYARNVPDSF